MLSELPTIPGKLEQIRPGDAVTQSPDLISGDILISFSQAFAYYLQEAQRRIGIVRVLRHIEARSDLIQDAACQLWEGVLRDRGMWPEGPENDEEGTEEVKETPA
jgi:hypothetical protein